MINPFGTTFNDATMTLAERELVLGGALLATKDGGFLAYCSVDGRFYHAQQGLSMCPYCGAYDLYPVVVQVGDKVGLMRYEGD